MSPLPIFPLQVIPKGFTEAHTKRSPLTYPPCPFSQVLSVEGLQERPVPVRPIATELMRQPAEQMVLEEVPSCSLPHWASHCLQRGQVRAAARARTTATTKTLQFMLQKKEIIYRSTSCAKYQFNPHYIPCSSRYFPYNSLITHLFHHRFLSICQEALPLIELCEGLVWRRAEKSLGLCHDSLYEVRCPWGKRQFLRNLIKLFLRFVRAQLVAQILDLPYFAVIELSTVRLELPQLADLPLHLPLHLLPLPLPIPPPPLLALPLLGQSDDAIGPLVHFHFGEIVVVVALVDLRLLEILVEEGGLAVALEGHPLHEGVVRVGPALALGGQVARSEQPLIRGTHQIGLPLRPLGNGLQTAVLLPVVIELALDDAQQPLVEFEQRFNFGLVLGIQLLLLLDFFEIGLDCLLEVGVLLADGLHLQYTAKLQAKRRLNT